MASIQEIAPQLEPKILNGRIIAFQAAQGGVVGYTIVLENEKEERSYLTISATLQSSLGGNMATVTPLINTSLTDWRK